MHVFTRNDPDIVFCRAYDRRTVAIRPDPHGRLRSLVQRTVDGRQRCWIYGAVQCWNDDEGNVRFDHIRQGVLCGPIAEGMGILTHCANAGLIVRRKSFYIPCAYGKERSGRFRRKRYGTNENAFADYHEDDLVLVRSDGRSYEELYRIAYAEAARDSAVQALVGRPSFFPGAQAWSCTGRSG